MGFLKYASFFWVACWSLAMIKDVITWNNQREQLYLFGQVDRSGKFVHRPIAITKDADLFFDIMNKAKAIEIGGWSDPWLFHVNKPLDFPWTDEKESTSFVIALNATFVFNYMVHVNSIATHIEWCLISPLKIALWPFQYSRDPYNTFIYGLLREVPRIVLQIFVNPTIFNETMILLKG